MEAQLSAGGSSWNYCAAAVDYDALRKEAASGLNAKVADVRGFVSKLGKAQRAAEIALDMSAALSARVLFAGRVFLMRYQRQCAGQSRA